MNHALWKLDGLSLEQALDRYTTEREREREVSTAYRIFTAAVERFGEDAWYKALGIGRDFTR